MIIQKKSMRNFYESIGNYTFFMFDLIYLINYGRI